MKPFRFLVPVAALCLLVGGCGQSDSAPLAAGVKPYPLDKCPVSDEKLGAMGDPVVFVHQGQQIKLCCTNCRKDFDAEPAKYLAKLVTK